MPNPILVESQEKDKDLFDLLPDEIIVFIFSHLAPEDLACRVSEVCTRWFSLAKDPVLWDNSALVFNDRSPIEFRKTILFAPCISKLCIDMLQDLDADTQMSILSSTAPVSYLSFYPSPSVSVDVKFNILNRYHNSLKGLDMYIDDSNLSSSKTLQQIFQMLSGMPCLQSLTLRGFINFGYVQEDVFGHGWGALDTLDLSGLSGRNLTASDSWQNFILLTLEHRASSLKKLSLPQNIIDLSLIDVFECKFAGSKIESLKVFEMYLSAVKNLNCLKTLHVVGLPPHDLKYLQRDCSALGFNYSSTFFWINGASQFSTVTQLTLENIPLDERNIIISLLHACRNLESLTVFSGFYSPSELEFFMRNLPSLKRLSIHRMSCLRSKHIGLIPHFLQSLTVLNIRHNNLTDGILQYYRDCIQPQMPDLQLLCDWGYWNKHGGQCWSRNLNVSNLFDMSTKADHLFESLSSDLPHVKDKVRMMLGGFSDYEDDT